MRCDIVYFLYLCLYCTSLLPGHLYFTYTYILIVSFVDRNSVPVQGLWVKYSETQIGTDILLGNNFRVDAFFVGEVLYILQV